MSLRSKISRLTANIPNFVSAVQTQNFSSWLTLLLIINYLSEFDLMSGHKCCINSDNKYQVRQRYNPTFVHSQIFNCDPLSPQFVRCTPTFQSTALDTEGYNLQVPRQARHKLVVRPNTALQNSIYINNTHEKRIQDLNPHTHALYTSRDKWFDHTKQQLIESIKECGERGYSKQRKIIDLSSDPVFTNFDYGHKVNQYCSQPKRCACNCTSCSCKCCGKKTQQKMTLNTQEAGLRGKQPAQKRVGQEFIIDHKQNENAANLQERKVLNDQKHEQIVQGSKNERKPSTKKKQDFHKNCVPQRQKQLTLKGKTIQARVQSAHKSRVVAQKPAFTVVRKNRIPL